MPDCDCTEMSLIKIMENCFFFGDVEKYFPMCLEYIDKIELE